MEFSWSTSSLLQIRLVVPRDELAVNPNKSVRKKIGGKDQRRRSPCGFPGAHPSKDRWRTDKRRVYWDTLINKWECGVRDVEPRRRPTWTTCSDDSGRGVHVTDRIRICAAAQPRQLLTEHGERPRTSARNWKVPTTTSAISKIKRRGQILDK